jgi:hypothetical protein
MAEESLKHFHTIYALSTDITSPQNDLLTIDASWMEHLALHLHQSD